MALPTTRDEFAEYCLRALGKPAIEINVTPDQVYDRISEALLYYADYHFDGTHKTYYKHQVTATDKLNKYITVPDNILGAIRVFPIADPSIRSDDLFNIRYQIALNDLYTLTSVSMVPYYMAMLHLQLLDEMLVGQQPIRFNRTRNRIEIDMDWDSINDGEYLLIEAYEVVDPEEFADVWKDRWLLRYATALIKRQWGNNLTKFIGMTLPGGIQFNGEKILNDAVNEITLLEQMAPSEIGAPLENYVG